MYRYSEIFDGPHTSLITAHLNYDICRCFKYNIYQCNHQTVSELKAANAAELISISRKVCGRKLNIYSTNLEILRRIDEPLDLKF